jgi:hypothetical protein
MPFGRHCAALAARCESRRLNRVKSLLRIILHAGTNEELSVPVRFNPSERQFRLAPQHENKVAIGYRRLMPRRIEAHR